MAENVNEFNLKTEEFKKTRDKLFSLLQKEENIEKRINFQEMIIKAEENIRNYQILIEQIDSNKNYKLEKKNKKEILDVKDSYPDNIFNNEKTQNSNVNKDNEIYLQNKSKSKKEINNQNKKKIIK